jgi:pimeloyl-ACP methyl ester carboxylesterase
MLPLEQMIRDAPWRRVYVDLPWAEGARASTATSALDVAHEVLAEIRDHFGTEPFAVVGQSFGGMIARYIAHELRDQVLGVATLAGVFEAQHSARNVPDRTVLIVDQAVVDHAGDARVEFIADHVVQSADTFAAFTEYVLPGVRGSRRAMMDRIAGQYALPVEPEVQHPQPFTAPALHIFGRQDEVVGYEDGWALRDHYTRATYAVLDTAGHSVHLERPDLTAALFRDWLDRMDVTGH